MKEVYVSGANIIILTSCTVELADRKLHRERSQGATGKVGILIQNSCENL